MFTSTAATKGVSCVKEEEDSARTTAEEPGVRTAVAASVESVGLDVAVAERAQECRLGLGQFRPPRVPAAESIRADYCFCCCLFGIRPWVHSATDCPYYPRFPLAERAWIAAATARCYKCL